MKSRDRFINLCAGLGISSAISTEAWKVLESRYSEAHRYYHNLRHIGSMLGKMDSADGGDAGMELAIWFHDVVYDPKARDNEGQSALLFESLLGGHLDSDLTKRVVRLILATDHSRARKGGHDEDLIRDLDLAILSSSEDEYQAYASTIRQEYAHVSEEDFKVGRGRVLSHFLGSPIFTTKTFSRNEAAARKNLEAERDILIRGK